MSKIKEQLIGLCVSLAELLVGILLLINPVAFTSGIITAVGLLMFVNGIISTFRYFLTAPAEAAKRQLLFKGMLAVLFGAFLILKSGWLLAAFPVLGVLYGLAVLLIGLVKVQGAVDKLRMKEANWPVCLLGAAISVICGAVIFANPFTSVSILWIFAGVSLIVEAAFDLVAVFYKEKESSAADFAPEEAVLGEIVEENTL